MPTRDEPRVTIRLGFALDGRLRGAAEGAGVKPGTLARRAMELGLEAAIEEARGVEAGRRGERVRVARDAVARVDGSPAARGERPGRAVTGGRLDAMVGGRLGGMLEARRAVNAGLVRVDGVVVRDPMTLVPAGARVVVES